MCQAVQDMCNESWSVGLEKGMEEGKEKGMEKGMEKCRIEDLQNLMTNTGWPLEQALSTLGVPKEDWEKYSQLIAQ